jgi:aminopeptidase 2
MHYFVCHVLRPTSAAIGLTRDMDLLNELFSYILTKTRDQDLVEFFFGLENNPLARSLVPQMFKDNYDTVSTFYFLLLC